MSKKLLVIIPTYHEIENIKLLLPAVFNVIPESAGILVVDDGGLNSDGTAEFVKSVMSNYGGRLNILERSEKRGLADAYISGFKWGLKNDFDLFLEMDADFSHNPKYIPELLSQMENFDVAIGSRNIKGGCVEGWSMLRNFISKGGSFYSCLVLGCPIKDFTGGFNMWTKEILLKIGLEKIISKGYTFQIEMKYRAFKNGAKIKEIPILFPDRKFGQSKMSGNIFMEALKSVWILRFSVK